MMVTAPCSLACAEKGRWDRAGSSTRPSTRSVLTRATVTPRQSRTAAGAHRLTGHHSARKPGTTRAAIDEWQADEPVPFPLALTRICRLAPSILSALKGAIP